MAAAGAHKVPCDIVELSSDEDEPNLLLPKGKEKGTEVYSPSPIPHIATDESKAAKGIGSTSTTLANLHNLPEDVFTFGSSPKLPSATSDEHRPQTLLAPPSIPPARAPSNRSSSTTDDDTPMRQAAKRRKLNSLLSSESAVAGEIVPHRSLSQAAPVLGSESKSTPEDREQYKRSARLKILQTALGFSDDDLSNFEVAVGGPENLLETLEEARAQKVREESESLFCSPGNDRYEGSERHRESRQPVGYNSKCRDLYDMPARTEGSSENILSRENIGKLSKVKGEEPKRQPLQEKSFNILSGLSDPLSPPSVKRRKSNQAGEAWRASLAKGLGEVEEGEYMPRPQPTILDLSEYFDDDLDDPLPPLQVSADLDESTARSRLPFEPSSREVVDGLNHIGNVASFGSKGKSTAALGKRRVSIVSLTSDPIVATSPRKLANAGKTNIWDLNAANVDQSTNFAHLQDEEDKKQGYMTQTEVLDHDVLNDVSIFGAGESEKDRSHLSESTTQLLARISAKSKARPRHRVLSESGDVKDDAKAIPRRSSISRTASLQSMNAEPISGSQSKTRKPPASKRSRLTSVEREEREQEKERVRALKAEERTKNKEGKKEQQRIEKEKRDWEKQVAKDLAEANKARTDRKVTTPEMIVDLPQSIEDTSVYTQVKPFLSDLNVHSTTYTSPVPDVVKFRRKVTARWSDTVGHWEPIPQTIESEKHILCLLSGKDFAKLATLDNGLENHVAKVRKEFPDSLPIYLIEGIEALLRKSRNSKNRAFVDSVRNGLSGVPGSQAQQRRNAAKAEEIVDADVIEDGLLQLQLIHKMQVHHTNASVETARWIAVFTQHVSTIPYK